MTYTKYPWIAGKTTPINATNLNHIEEGIYDAHELHRDLIAGATPTYSSWTVDPTDGANITDGDISTFCVTGNKVAGGGYQSAVFEWDLGTVYNVFISGVGAVAATAGTPAATVSFYDGASWITGEASLVYSTGVTSFTMHGAMASKVRLNLFSNSAATITPNIREFHTWRMG